jgi:hypothetical protein
MIHADNRFWLALLFLGTCLPAIGADPEVKAGGVVLVLPGPANDFAQAGDKLRTTFFELLVPSVNRLLSAYVPARTLAELDAGKTPGKLDVYAMVEVLRQAEYADCTPEIFDQVVSSMGSFDMTKVDVQQELDARLKALGSKPIELGRPEMLGGIFRKPDAAGFAMLLAVKQDNSTSTMAGGIGLVRVKQRVIFLYLYNKYESPDTISWLHKNLEAWCDAILAKNR